MRWALQRGTAVIPKSENPVRMAENIDLLGFRLDQAEMDAISCLNKNKRYNDPDIYYPDLFSYAIFDWTNYLIFLDLLIKWKVLGRLFSIEQTT